MQTRDAGTRTVSEDCGLRIELKTAGAIGPKDAQNVAREVVPFLIPRPHVAGVRHTLSVEGITKILSEELGGREHRPAVGPQQVLTEGAGEASAFFFAQGVRCALLG